MDKFLIQLIPLILLLVVMYFLLIRPQKKKEKSINDMRSSLQVGDEVVTIGGICGKIVKTKDESIVIQVGADKVKFEMMRWSISSVVNPSKAARPAKEEESKKAMPKRLKKSEDEIKEVEEDEN
ncbi:MAG: preprotein translocase subunit YajC [Eubacteriales bacterium]|nr:preprotein translocase subunit YajC [Eubacteriales bacterium]